MNGIILTAYAEKISFNFSHSSFGAHVSGFVWTSVCFFPACIPCIPTDFILLLCRNDLN